MKRAAEIPKLTDGGAKVQQSRSEIETDREVRRDGDHTDKRKTERCAGKTLALYYVCFKIHRRKVIFSGVGGEIIHREASRDAVMSTQKFR